MEGSLVLEWPLEKRSRTQGVRRESAFSEAWFESVRAASSPNTKKLDAAVEALVSAYWARTDPELALSQLDEALTLHFEAAPDAARPDPHDGLMALACLEALRQLPTADTWGYLWSLTGHSRSLETTLPEAIINAAGRSPAFKSEFLTIASEVVKQAAADPGRREMVHNRDFAAQSFSRWNDDRRLSYVWREPDLTNHIPLGDDDGVLEIVAQIDLPAFVNLLEAFDSPYPVGAALQTAGVRVSLRLWKDIMALAPVAFRADGTWTGSVIVPLLLVVAREQIRMAQNWVAADANPVERDTVRKEMQDLAVEVAKTIASRPDAGGCAVRWAASLMRGLMGELARVGAHLPDKDNLRGYADAVLIEMLGRECDLSRLGSVALEALEPWEPWCYLRTLSLWAQEGLIAMPYMECFLEQWYLSPEDWGRERGQCLRDNALLNDVLGGWPPDAYGTRLLGYMIADKQDPAETWDKLWRKTVVIRDIVEFGDAEKDDEAEWKSQGPASALMQLAFGLGLMMLERIVISPSVPYERPSALKRLFRALVDTVREMRAIDRYHGKFWDAALRHLAIRRALWVAENPVEAPYSRTVDFEPDTTPTLAGFVRDMGSDVENLLAMLAVLERNGVARETLRAALADVEVDMKALIALAKKLQMIDCRRYPFSDAQIALGTDLAMHEAVQ